MRSIYQTLITIRIPDVEEMIKHYDLRVIQEETL